MTWQMRLGVVIIVLAGLALLAFAFAPTSRGRPCTPSTINHACQ
jgi:hypothetical protein